MNISDRSNATVLISAIESTGAAAPKIAAAYARAVKISEAAKSLSVPQDALAIAVFAALEAGRDPGADEEVRRVLALNAVANPGITTAVDAQAFETFRGVCRTSSATVIKALRVPFDAAAVTLAGAHALIGDVPLEDTATIVARGGAAADAWARATGAVRVIDAALTGWQALGTITGTSSSDRRYRVLRLAEVDYSTWVDRELEGSKMKVWDVVRAGLTLSLPTVTEYRERVAVITAAEANLERLDQQAGQDRMTGRIPAAVR